MEDIVVVVKITAIMPEAFCLEIPCYSMSVLLLVHKIIITRMSQISKLIGRTTK